MNEHAPAKAGGVAGAVGVVAWGYVFLYLDVNLGALNILPDWVCYALVLKALPGLARLERSALLLRPLAWVLLAVDAAEWALGAVGITLDIYLVTAVVSVLSLYFHFQLLTNIADIAAQVSAERERGIRRLRNFSTVFSTILALRRPLDRLSGDALSAVGVAFIVGAIVLVLWTFGALFGLKHDVNLEALEHREEDVL